MKVETLQPGFYFLILFLSAGLFAIALGPGVWGNAGDGIHSWQHLVFGQLCHQDPARSLSFGGSVMAVCSRCIGIYGAFFTGVLGMPLISRNLEVRNRFFLQLMAGAIVLNALDVVLNLTDIWTNSLVSRFLLGSLIGATAAIFLTRDFFNTNLDSEIHHEE